MQTIQILRQLIHSIRLRPSVTCSIPWDEIQSCILTEFECCAGIYPASQFESINRLLTEIITEGKQASSAAQANTIVHSLEKLAFSLEFLPEDSHIDGLLNQANFDHACLNHYRNNTIIVLGDSHVNFFSGNENLTFLPIGHGINTCFNNISYPFTPLHTGPCLAYNCNRLDTTFRFHEKVTYLCQNFIQPHAKIICCLGEIDLRVHVFKQASLQNRTYQEIADDILTEYIRFLISLKNQGYRVCCWGPIASQTESCPLDPKFPRNGTEIERNKATAYFNRQLAILCQKYDIVYLSIFDKMITADYRTLGQYLSPDRCHLSQSALSLAIPEWQKLL